MSNFVDLGITPSASSVASVGVEYLEQHIEGYEPNPGNFEVILIEAVAQMIAGLEEGAGEVPQEVFREFGEQLIKLAPNDGAFARVTLTFEAIGAAPSEGYKIPAETFVSINEKGFATIEEVVIPSGETTVPVEAVATELGTAWNGLSTNVELSSSLAYIQAVTVVAPSSGGENEEPTAEYMSRLTTFLGLMAPRPITAVDYANFLLSADLPGPEGGFIEVARAVALDGYKPGEKAFECKIETGHLTELKEVSLTEAEIKEHFTEGTEIEGPEIVPGTTVASVNASGKIITLNTAASGTHAKASGYKALGTYKNERCVGAFALGPDGGTLTKADLEAIETYVLGSATTGRSINGVQYPGFREINFLFTCESPLETSVNIHYSLYMLPGYQKETVESQVAAALGKLLSPETWGTVNAYQSNIPWLNDRYVRYNKVIGVIQDVPGVDYVEELHISTNHSPTPGTSSVVLVGPTPLPRALSSETASGEVESTSEVVKGLTKSASRTVGMFVSGTDVTAGTYVTEVKSETEVKLSANATATNTKASLVFSNILAEVKAEVY